VAILVQLTIELCLAVKIAESTKTRFLDFKVV